ncbi:MAG TPA: hypothetical protein VMM93_02415 [Vicinamibacterales bacterium]|nr:hypothetical protein [Vicinamibacterales bacterium]
MVPLTELWMPILLSAVFVFVASSLIHMVLTYHRSDFGRLPDEDTVLAALRPLELPPGDYFMPHGESMAAMKDPAFLAKMHAGPVAIMTVRPSGPPAMGTSLVQWFLFSVIVSVIAAYIAGRALEHGADYLSVFRFAGTTAFVAYAIGQIPNSIWMGRAWSTTIKGAFDGFVYALLTAGVFGWLWP